MPAKPLPPEALVELRRRLSALPARSPARRHVIQEAATAYDVSEATIYRALKRRSYPRAAHRVDQGTPRVLPVDQLGVHTTFVQKMSLTYYTHNPSMMYGV
jgi:hypothetical protein